MIMMKKTYAIVFVGLMLFFSSLITGCGQSVFTDLVAQEKTADVRSTDLFEKAVAIIKKYETLHSPKHWPLVGYGHKVLPGEKFSRKRALSEKEADALLRKDLKKLCAIYRSYGQDSILLATLAYNIGHGAVNRSSVVSRLKSGDRNIRETYISYCRYRGKQHAGIKRRRVEEFENLFIDRQTAFIDPKSTTPLFLRPFIDDSRSDESLRDRIAEAIFPDDKSKIKPVNELPEASSL